MHVDPLEKKWVYISILLTGVMVVILFFYAVSANINPPSNVETIDSTTLHLSDEFAEDKLGIRSNGDGSYTVTMVAARYGFYPQHIEVPADTPITLRIASADVLHGVHGPYTNMNTMVVPGYISQLTTQFSKPGEVPLFCNEYCGLGHDHMWSRLMVVPKSEFKL
jgi:cytochrome c oxidase subunit 2